MKRLIPGVLLLPLFFAHISVQAVEDYAIVEASYQEVMITGFTRASATMELAVEVAGRATAIYAEMGESIPEKGQFACLDDKLITLDIQASENAVSRHAVEINYFNKQVSRYEKLMNKNSTAQSQLDELIRQLGVSRRLQQAEKIQKEKLLETRRRHCVSAPAGWQVIERSIEPGQWINTGQVIARLGNYSRLLVPVYLSQQELIAVEKVESGLEAVLPDYDKKVSAQVERISPAFDEKSRKFKVELLLEEALPAYHGGIRLELMLKVPDKQHTFLLLDNTLEERFEEFWLERQDGKEIRVDLLGYQKRAGKRLARVVSPVIKAGDQFKIRAR